MLGEAQINHFVTNLAGRDAMSVELSLASAVVWMDIEAAPAVTTPMVSPLSVTVTAMLTANDEAVSVSTMAVVVGAALVAVTAPPLNAAVGVDDIVQKAARIVQRDLVGS